MLSRLEIVTNMYRTPAVGQVLDYVRRTGKSAHPFGSDIVGMATVEVAEIYGYDARELQAAINRYSDALDALNAIPSV